MADSIQNESIFSDEKKEANFLKDSVKMAGMGYGYTFYVGGVKLPVTPSSIVMRIRNQNKTVNLINQGQVNLLRPPGLSEISFTALIPQQKYPFALYTNDAKFRGADYYLNRFELLKNAKRPFQFILARSSPEGEEFFHNNIKVTMESYDVREDARNGTDIEVDISLLEYKNYGTKPIPDTEKVLPKKEERPVENPPEAKTYTVVAGDCLWSIAQRFLGDGNRYPELYSLNQSLIDAQNQGTGNPRYTIYPKQVFQLPRS